MAKQETFSCFTVEILDSDTWDTPSHPRLDGASRIQKDGWHGLGGSHVPPTPDSPKDGVWAKIPPTRCPSVLEGPPGPTGQGAWGWG